MLKRDKYDRLHETLGDLPFNERNKLLKQASVIRKVMKERGKRVSLDELVIQLAKGEEPFVPEKTSKLEDGTIVWSGLKTANVGTTEVLLNGHRACVGDQVVYATLTDGQTKAIVEIKPRRTQLARPDVDNHHIERVVAANIDLVAIVVSIKSPPFHPRLIDRYLIAVQAGGAEPIICLNKLDLMDDREAEIAKLEPYVAIGIPIFGCSTETGEGINDLRESLSGRTCVFVGHSGVGKSSLLNAVFPSLELKVGSLMKNYGRGAHTTTASSLFELENGTKLIDTPGIRSFGLAPLDREELQAYFPEFAGEPCKFRDCTHLHEPGCSVQARVDRGHIHPARFDTYRRLCEEMKVA